jgi:hypothetical protein
LYFITLKKKCKREIFFLTLLDRSSIMVIIKLEEKDHEQADQGKAKASDCGTG